MAGLKLNIFSGLRPLIPESLLPEHAATVAQNCDLAYGELRNTKDGFALTTMSNIPASIYTDDGVTFFSWTTDTDAVRSPLANDLYNRLYYTGGDGFRVTDRLNQKVTGGQPSSSYLVGVVRPTVAPSVSVSVPVVNTTNATIEYIFHYEYGGVKYQEQAITPTVLSDSQVRFTPPTKEVDPSTVSDSGSSSGDPVYRGTDTFSTGGTGNLVLSTYYKTRPTSIFNNQPYYAYWPGRNELDPSVIYWMVSDDQGNWLNQSTLFHVGEGWFSVNSGDSPPISGSSSGSGTTATGNTPANAFPVLRMKATYKADNSQAFDIYTPNSTLGTKGGLFHLSMTKDENAESYTVTYSTGVDEAEKETRAYIFTQVNTYNEEGPPSDPVLVTTSPVMPIDITLTPNRVTGYAPLKELRIYRTGTGTVSTDYYYVGKVDVLTSTATTATFTDDVKAEMLNEVMSSLDSYPPDQSLRGLMALPNGILCAWKGNELWFSEAYRPWAWPPKYTKTLPHAIVGGIAHGSGAIITTTTNPFVLSGVSPDSMTAAKINVTQAGVSKWSMAVVEGSVVYASHDGIVSINGMTGNLDASQRFFTREVWRARCPSLSSMRFAVWDGRLVVFSNSNAFTPFMIRMDEAAGTMTDLPGMVAKCSFVSPLSDQFYYTNGQVLYQFNGGTEKSAVWQSRELVLPSPVNFGAAQAVVEGSWSVEFWAYVQTSSGFTYQLKHTKALTSGTSNFRLPSGFESDRYRVKVTGSGRFRELRMARTFKELSTV